MQLLLYWTVLCTLGGGLADSFHEDRDSLEINVDMTNVNVDGRGGTRTKRALHRQVENKEYWMEQGRKELEAALNKKTNLNLAKNIILVIGDGMSLDTVSAARAYKSKSLGLESKNIPLSWETFPDLGLSKTYNVDALVPDSAATAFAMVSGVKTNYYTVGFDSSIRKGDPDSALSATQVETILDWSQRAGLKTGLVTNARVTHATPAALYAKTAHRDWECDRQMPLAARAKVKDITEQLVTQSPGRDLDVILGGGRGSFTPTEYEEQLLLFSPNQINFNSGSSKFDCSRLDNVDMVETWKKINKDGEFVQTRSELNNVSLTNPDKLLGLFSWSYMPYHDELNSTLDIPTLKQMTEQAISFLEKKSSQGYFLMVEGGRVDHAHHEGTAVRALSETMELDRTVEYIMNTVDKENTLVIVTADHSHTMKMGGYPGRKADIGGVVKGDNGWVMKGLDGHAVPILQYTNGPGFKHLKIKKDRVKDNWEGIERSNSLQEGEPAGFAYRQTSGVPLNKETHGGDDVGIWASGPLSHLFHTTHQQSYIGHVMSLAGCIGPHSDSPRCADLSRT